MNTPSPSSLTSSASGLSFTASENAYSSSLFNLSTLPLNIMEVLLSDANPLPYMHATDGIEAQRIYCTRLTLHSSCGGSTSSVGSRKNSPTETILPYGLALPIGAVNILLPDPSVASSRKRGWWMA